MAMAIRERTSEERLLPHNWLEEARRQYEIAVEALEEDTSMPSRQAIEIRAQLAQAAAAIGHAMCVGRMRA